MPWCDHGMIWAIIVLLAGILLAGFGLLVIVTREFPGDLPGESTTGPAAVIAGFIVFGVGVALVFAAVKKFIGS